MPQITTKLTQKGQVTLPRSVRDQAGLKPRDAVTVEVEGDVVKIRRATSRIAAGYGAISGRRKPEDFRVIRDEFESGVADEVQSETA
jgi:AbrB family looped-hinge helix DNA binding protein